MNFIEMRTTDECHALLGLAGSFYRLFIQVIGLRRLSKGPQPIYSGWEHLFSSTPLLSLAGSFSGLLMKGDSAQAALATPSIDP